MLVDGLGVLWAQEQLWDFISFLSELRSVAAADRWEMGGPGTLKYGTSLLVSSVSSQAASQEVDGGCV